MAKNKKKATYATIAAVSSAGSAVPILPLSLLFDAAANQALKKANKEHEKDRQDALAHYRVLMDEAIEGELADGLAQKTPGNLTDRDKTILSYFQDENLARLPVELQAESLKARLIAEILEARVGKHAVPHMEGLALDDVSLHSQFGIDTLKQDLIDLERIINPPKKPLLKRIADKSVKKVFTSATKFTVKSVLKGMGKVGGKVGGKIFELGDIAKTIKESGEIIFVEFPRYKTAEDFTADRLEAYQGAVRHLAENPLPPAPGNDNTAPGPS